MGFKILVFLLMAFCLSAQAQNSCGSLFTEAITDQNINPIFLELNKVNIDLVTALKKGSRSLDRSAFFREAKDLENKAEMYFQAAGINFQKSRTEISIRGLRDIDQLEYSAPVYHLSGTARGDEISRLIYGAQSNKMFVHHPLKVRFELFYQLTNEVSAHYQVSTNTVVIGPHVIGRDLAGTEALLRHELQHAFEQMRIRQGEMTLARIQLMRVNLEKSETYEDFFRQDEMETHLRELRVLAHPDRQNKEAKFFAALGSEVSRPQVLAVRKYQIQFKLWVLESLIQSSKAANSLIELHLYSPQQPPRLLSTSEGLLLSVTLPGPYPMAELNLRGVLRSDWSDPSDIKAAAIQILGWNNRRILQIEKEKNAIKARLSRQ